jgi:small-conductance mechanosensitive channel
MKVNLSLKFVLLVLGLIFLGLASFKVPELPRVSWGWLGAFCIGLALLTTI